ncbi:MAG: hypothetical protein KJO53_00600 [Eudoraea sp.]|nr:hypothetical protein [Eudoraea sp.]
MKKLLSFMFIASLLLVSCEVEQFEGQDLTSINGKAKNSQEQSKDEEYSEGRKCETAFGRGCDCDEFNTCFSDHGFNRWGWSVLLNNGFTTYDFELIAGAGQCLLDKGTKVGSVKVTVSDNRVVSYHDIDLKPGYTLEEFHFYAGESELPKKKNGKYTVAPGQYYNEGSDSDGNAYVILHAVVCGEFED